MLAILLTLVGIIVFAHSLGFEQSDADSSPNCDAPSYSGTNYTVTITVNYSSRGSVDKTSVTVPSGTSISTSGNVLTIGSTKVTATQTPDNYKMDYNFENWRLKNGSSYSAVPSTVTGDITIVAMFSGYTQVYTISFEVNNPDYGRWKRPSSTSTVTSTTISGGTKISVSGTSVSLDTNQFVFQVTNNSYQYTASFSYISAPSEVTGPTTITAYVSLSLNYYTLTIKSNNSTYGGVTKASVSVPYGTSYSTSGSKLSVYGNTIYANPTTDTDQYHYAFGSWSSTSGTITRSTTITANFTREIKSYAVAFESNDASWGSISPSSVSVPYGSAVSLSDNTLTIGTMIVTATPSPDDSSYTYAFSSWQNVPTTITGATTITAIFTATQAGHTVQYYYDGSKISGYDELVPHGGTITHTTYSSGDLIFCGWYTDSSFESQYLFTSSTPVNQNYVMYAQMAEPITFTSSPVADATITYLSWAGMVLFDSVGANSPYRVIWDFGDGTSSTDRTAYHLYSEPGTYTVKLSAYNYAGDVDTKEYHITISNEHQQQSDRTAFYVGGIIATIIATVLIIRIF